MNGPPSLSSGSERLLEYIERPPVSLERLEYRDDGKILYRGNYNPSLSRDYQFCSPVEFLAMLVPHVRGAYFVYVRYLGA
ncbi:MAG: transposase [Planctomycetota bacterium]|nr:transposase [Planctomycetota bacterium]